MKTISKFIFILFFISSTTCSADTIVMNSGKTYEGDIYDYSEHSLRIETISGRKINVKFNQIHSIDIENPSESKKILLEMIQNEIATNQGLENNLESTPLDKENKSSNEVKSSESTNADSKNKSEQYVIKSKKQKRRKQVHLYKKMGCPYVAKMERFLKANNIKYQSFNIQHDSSARKRYKQYGGKVVPFLVIDGYTVQGYNPERVMWLYRQ